MTENIQAVLFNRDYWTTTQAREYLKANGDHTTDKYHCYRLTEPYYNKYHYLFRRGKNNIDYIIKILMPNKHKRNHNHILYDKIKNINDK